eukprot:gene13421-14800_t
MSVTWFSRCSFLVSPRIFGTRLSTRLSRRMTRIHRRVELGEHPLYRPFEWNREERDRVKKNRIPNWYKNGKYVSMIFIQSTSGSELKRKYQNEIDRCGVRIRVVEKAGRSLKSQLQRSDPFKEASCNRETCLICEIGGQGSCSKDGINHEIACVGCEQQGRDVKYHGGSSKNGFTRGRQHLEELGRRSESSVIWRHCSEKHDGEIQDFKMNITGNYRNDAISGKANTEFGKSGKKMKNSTFGGV